MQNLGGEEGILREMRKWRMRRFRGFRFVFAAIATPSLPL